MSWNPVLWNPLLRVSNFAMELEWKRRYGWDAFRSGKDAPEDCQEDDLEEGGRKRTNERYSQEGEDPMRGSLRSQTIEIHLI